MLLPREHWLQGFQGYVCEKLEHGCGNGAHSGWSCHWQHRCVLADIAWAVPLPTEERCRSSGVGRTSRRASSSTFLVCQPTAPESCRPFLNGMDLEERNCRISRALCAVQQNQLPVTHVTVAQ
mmetsp:Transcript_43231/g.99658  ORF Transcript_43231/g.99658 Transcript_43231/m.99658 type:complete len:123 (-) Transcript_43231:42-410(-)